MPTRQPQVSPALPRQPNLPQDSPQPTLTTPAIPASCDDSSPAASAFHRPLLPDYAARIPPFAGPTNLHAPVPPDYPRLPATRQSDKPVLRPRPPASSRQANPGFFRSNPLRLVTPSRSGDNPPGTPRRPYSLRQPVSSSRSITHQPSLTIQRRDFPISNHPLPTIPRFPEQSIPTNPPKPARSDDTTSLKPPRQPAVSPSVPADVSSRPNASHPTDQAEPPLATPTSRSDPPLVTGHCSSLPDPF